MIEEVSHIRESYLNFPKYMQNFLTWLTGKAIKGQKPFFLLNKWVHFFVPFGLFCGGVLANLYLVPRFASYEWVLRSMFWILTVAGVRNMVLTIRHECVHNNFVTNPQVNKILGEFVTIVLLIRTAKEYQHDHVSLHHNSDILCTAQDPHVNYLSKYGLKFGVKKKDLWLRLIFVLLSPLFYIGSTYGRIKANILAKNSVRRLFALLYITMWSLILTFSSVSFYQFILAYAFPVFVLSEASAFIETISEHPIPQEETNGRTLKERRLMLAKKSWCILSGTAWPTHSRIMLVNVYRKIVWFIQMIGHLFVRLTILPGPLPSHELHHRKPGQYDWRIAFYERQKDIEANHPGYPPYTEVWGLINALDIVFDGMSKRSPS